VLAKVAKQAKSTAEVGNPAKVLGDEWEEVNEEDAMEEFVVVELTAAK
jgi:hypothetical protein